MFSALASKVSNSSIVSSLTTSDESLPGSSSGGLRQLEASVRRLSIPISKARKLSQRRLSQMVTAISEVIDIEPSDGA